MSGGKTVHRYTIVLLALGVSARAETLRLHQPLERELRKGQPDVFTVESGNAQFVKVAASKKVGDDVIVTITSPSGKTLIIADGPSYSFNPVQASWITQSPGIYSIQVSKAARSSQPARYQIELKDLRQPSENDPVQIEAQAKLYSAAGKDRAGDRESRSAAIRLYEDAASLWRGLNERSEEALCLHRIGSLYSELGDQPKALDYLQKALGIRRDTGDRPSEALTLNNIGVAYSRMGEQPKALDSYQRALSIRSSLGDPSSEAVTLTNIASVYSILGEQEKTLDTVQHALSARHAAGDRAGEADTLITLAFVYHAMDEPQKSIDTYQLALSMKHDLGDRIGEAFTLSILGNVYRDLGGEQKALDFYQQALTVYRTTSNRFAQGDTLIGIGDVYFFLGEKQKSLDYYQQSITLKHEAGDRSGEALALIGIANVYSDLASRQRPPDFSSPADKQKALEYYLQSLAIGRADKDYNVQVFALMGAGVVYSALGDKQKALEYLNQALFIFSFARSRPGEGWARYEMARVERDTGNLKKSLELAANARGIIENLRAKVISPDLRALFFAAVQDCYTLEMDVLMRMHSAEPGRNYQEQALTASERARARVLLEILGEAQADIREGVDPLLLERERVLQTQLNGKETARMQMMAAKHTPEMLRDIEGAVRDLATQYEEVNTRIRASSPHYAALKFPQPLSLSEIQKEVLDQDTLLLEFALGDQRSFLWVVSSDSITGVALPKRSEIEAVAKSFLQSLTNSEGVSGADAGKALSRMLLGSVTSHLGDKRLLIVTDGALQYVPFAALPDPEDPSQPLVARHEIVNAPSASTLAVLRRETLNRKPAAKTLAILADPVFSVDDSRISRSLTAQRGIATSLNDLGLSGLRLPRLPGTRREAAGIIALVPESERKQALDFDANRATLISPELSQYRILHLATHGLLNTAHPELSGVVLSLVDRQGKPQDGFLRLHEIYNLKLSADLVVLSACQTGLGKEIQGEGLVGLTRGFMYAGAPRILASLWKVDDRATAELMKRFYGAMLGSNTLRPAAALRAAQIEMWKTKGWENPYYWAAFTLQGEWK